MATRSASRKRGFLIAAVALLLSTSLGAGAGVDLKESCAATPQPDLCTSVLQADPSTKDATTPRGLAEVAIRAASNVGAAAGTFARAELDVVKDNAMWQCLDECAKYIEEAVAHLDDTEGEIDDAKFNDVRLFLDTAERDSWSCDECCKFAPETPVKAALLAKNKDFEALMAVTNALIKRATRGDAPTAAPSSP